MIYRLIKGCVYCYLLFVLFIFVGYCLVYNIVVKKMDFWVCFGKYCFEKVFIFDVVYKCIF